MTLAVSAQSCMPAKLTSHACVSLRHTCMVIQSIYTVSVKLHLGQDRWIESAPTMHNWHQCTSRKANLFQHTSWNAKVATILVNLSVSKSMLRQLYFTTMRRCQLCMHWPEGCQSHALFWKGSPMIFCMRAHMRSKEAVLPVTLLMCSWKVCMLQGWDAWRS